MALSMADYVFGGGASGSRLFNRVRGKEGLSYAAGSSVSTSDQDALGRFSLLAICNPANIDKVERAIGEELARLVRDGITEQELATAKKAIREQSTLMRSDDLFVVSALVEDLPLGRTFAYDAERDRKRAALTVDAVNQAVRKHLAPEKLVIFRAGDFKKK
jgi:zinc protease